MPVISALGSFIEVLLNSESNHFGRSGPGSAGCRLPEVLTALNLDQFHDPTGIGGGVCNPSGCRCFVLPHQLLIAVALHRERPSPPPARPGGASQRQAGAGFH